MVKLYADEQFPLPVVKILRILGYDILTVQDAGKAEQKIPDPEVLHYAISLNRAVLTMNRRDVYRDWETDRKSTRLNSSHSAKSRMPSSA